jgi:hypothetical protein
MSFQLIAENGQKFYVNEDLPAMDANDLGETKVEAEARSEVARTPVLTTNEGYDVLLQDDGSYLIVDLELPARKK